MQCECSTWAGDLGRRIGEHHADCTKVAHLRDKYVLLLRTLATIQPPTSCYVCMDDDGTVIIRGWRQHERDQLAEVINGAGIGPISVDK
jgi:hypothetical protein